MGSWLSLISSFVIGGLVLVNFNRFTSEVTIDTNMETLDHISYGEMNNVGRLLQYDLARMGYGITDPEIVPIITADTSDIKFLLDADGNGTIDSLRYYLSTVSAASATPNPNDRLLYRRVNNGAVEVISTGLTSFTMNYRNSMGATTAVPESIRTIGINLQFESSIIDDGNTPRMAWQGRVTPPNLVMN